MASRFFGGWSPSAPTAPAQQPAQAPVQAQQSVPVAQSAPVSAPVQQVAQPQAQPAAPANPPAANQPQVVERRVVLDNPPAQGAPANQVQDNVQTNRNAQNAPVNDPPTANRNQAQGAPITVNNQSRSSGNGCRNTILAAVAGALLMCFLGGLFLIWLFGGGLPTGPIAFPPIGDLGPKSSGGSNIGVKPPVVIDPQTQVRHPSMYWETGKSGSETWQGSIPTGSVLIVGGVCVDGLCDGTYKAIAGPKDVSLKVQNGFVLIIESKWAQEEWCFRIGQTVQYGWANKNLTPLSGWTTCPK
jgi:hypothetical protein